MKAIEAQEARGRLRAALCLLVLLLVLLLAAPVWAQDYPPELPPLQTPETIFRALGFPVMDDAPLPGVTEGDVVTIDVLVVLASGVATSHCQSGITRINQTAVNSGAATVQVRLVGCLPTTYVSSGSASTDLSRFTGTADGFLDEVHAERNRVGADTNVLVGKSGDACGVAYLNSSAGSAFAYVNDGCLSNSSFEHEWGHNVGMAHDLPNAGFCPFGYGCGWCFGNGRKDVLTYPSPCGGSRAPYYSNPDILNNGTPTGTATANNARVLRERAAVLANFRPTVNPRQPAPPVRLRVEPPL
jgi:hypothetical protein